MIITKTKGFWNYVDNFVSEHFDSEGIIGEGAHKLMCILGNSTSCEEKSVQWWLYKIRLKDSEKLCGWLSSEHIKLSQCVMDKVPSSFCY